MNQLATRFPRVYAVFNQFKNGSVQLVKDAKTTITLKPEVGKWYTPEKLVTYYEFRTDVRRCLPVFVLFWIPFIGQWLALPLAFFFPQQTLSRQFWTDEQRRNALDKMLDIRKEAYPQLADKLLISIDRAKVDRRLAQISSDVLQQIIKGKRLEEGEAKMFHRLFSESNELSPPRMPIKHMKHLVAAWNSDQLHKKAAYLVNVDSSLAHFGVQSQPQSILDMVCHHRGLRLSGRSTKDCCNYMADWGRMVDGKYSNDGKLGFVLHLPMLMQNNEPVRSVDNKPMEQVGEKQPIKKGMKTYNKRARPG